LAGIINGRSSRFSFPAGKSPGFQTDRAVPIGRGGDQPRA
jgi:hypothetical protein